MLVEMLSNRCLILEDYLLNCNYFAPEKEKGALRLSFLMFSNIGMFKNIFHYRSECLVIENIVYFCTTLHKKYVLFV